MIELKQLKNSKSPNVESVMKLMYQAFPYEERRDDEAWIDILDNNKNFSLYEILDDNCFAGFITLWSFDEFDYVEHFAILPQLRSRSLGTAVIEKIISISNKHIVLEVESPNDDVDSEELAIRMRRINFYKNRGFQLIDYEYFQPPYHVGGDYFPLKLMVKIQNSCQIDVKEIAKILYRRVYFCKN